MRLCVLQRRPARGPDQSSPRCCSQVTMTPRYDDGGGKPRLHELPLKFHFRPTKDLHAAEAQRLTLKLGVEGTSTYALFRIDASLAAQILNEVTSGHRWNQRNDIRISNGGLPNLSSYSCLREQRCRFFGTKNSFFATNNHFLEEPSPLEWIALCLHKGDLNNISFNSGKPIQQNATT